MWSKYIFLLAFLMTLQMALSSCSARDGFSRDLRPTFIQKVKGDPFVFVANSEMNDSGLPFTVLTASRRWVLTVQGFEQELRQEPGEVAQAKIERETETVAKPEQIFDLQVTATKVILSNKSSNTDNTDSTEFEFEKDDKGNLKLATLKIENRIEQIGPAFDVEDLHYSYSQTKESISILVYNKKAKHLHSYVFSRNTETRNLETGSSFQYMFGKGVQIGWDQEQPLKLMTCGEGHPELLSLTSQAVEQWMGPLKGRLNFSETTNEKCPPFSDLQTHSLNYIDGWVSVEGEMGIWGTTYLLSEGKHIADGDIFIFNEEFDELFQLSGYKEKLHSDHFSTNEKTQKIVLDTLLHEIGHFLGLGHVIGTPSIMAYDRQSATLQAYDIKAIENLYPFQDTSSDTK